MDSPSHIEVSVSPSVVPAIVQRANAVNDERAAARRPRMTVSTSEVRENDLVDPIIVHESVCVCFDGAVSAEAERCLDGLPTAPEKKVKAGDLMGAAVVAHRLNAQVYIGRGQGPAAIPDLMERFVHEGPDGPLRTRLATTQQDLDEAGRVRIWVRSQPKAHDRYELALQTALRSEFVPIAEVGVAVSALRGFTEHQKQLEAAKERYLERQRFTSVNPSAVSPWVGTINEHVSITARVELAHPVRSDKSDHPRLLYILRTSTGELIRWFAAETQGFEVGDTVSLNGRVKAHQTFNGEAQTEIWYCKNIEIHAPDRH